MIYNLFCPDCPKEMIGKRGTNRRRQCGPRLKLWERNWHGTGEDAVACERCSKTFAVTYKVNEIIPWADQHQCKRCNRWNLHPLENGICEDCHDKEWDSFTAQDC